MPDKIVNHFVLADGSTAKYDAGGLLNLDETVSLVGYAPDAKAVGDRLTDVENLAETLNEGGLELKDDVIGENVDDWMDTHPEASTTVLDDSLTTAKYKDGSVTTPKLADGAVTENKLAPASVVEGKVNVNFLAEIKNAYVTPEMFGAVGDGETDDTAAIKSAIDSKLSVFFVKEKTYLISDTITIPEDTIIYGNNATVKKTTSGYAFLLKSYDTFISGHWWETSAISNLVIDADYCIDMLNAIRFRLENITCRLTSVGINIRSGGYECLLDNIFFWASGVNEATALIVDTTDCTFNNLFIVNAKYGIEIKRGANRFNNVHGWLATAGNYDGSVMVVDKSGMGAGLELNQFYFDTYQTGIYKYNWSPVVVNAPYWFTNENIVLTNNAYLVKFSDTLLADSSRLALSIFEITDFSCSLSTNAIENFDISNAPISGGKPFKFGYIYMDWNMVLKATNNNLYYLTNGQVEDITDRWITFESGFSLVSGYVHKEQDKVVINCVIKSDTDLPVRTQINLGTLLYKLRSGAINSFVLNSDGQWGGNAQNIGYIYIGGNTVSVNTVTSGNQYIKINLEYPI